MGCKLGSIIKVVLWGITTTQVTFRMTERGGQDKEATTKVDVAYIKDRGYTRDTVVGTTMSMADSVVETVMEMEVTAAVAEDVAVDTVEMGVHVGAKGSSPTPSKPNMDRGRITDSRPTARELG